MIFQEKYFCRISLTVQISLPPLVVEMLSNICIVIVCYPCCDIANFETSLSFLMKLFQNMTEKSGHKVQYFENKKAFKVK